MKKITRGDFDFHMTLEGIWQHVEGLQSELEALEGRKGMTFEWDRHRGCAGARIIYEYGNFGEVSWDSDGPKSKATPCLSGDGYIRAGEYIPRPPKVTRERTRQWKIEKLVELGWETYAALNCASDKILNMALEKEGISTTTEEA